MKKCFFNMFTPFRNYTSSFLQGVDFIKTHQKEFCKENNITYLSKNNFLNECDVKLRATSALFGLNYNEKIAISDYMRCKYALELLNEYDIVIYADMDMVFLKEFRLPAIDPSVPIYIAKEITVENHSEENLLIKETNSVTNPIIIFTKQSKKILETVLINMIQLSESDKELHYGSYCTVMKEIIAKTKTKFIYGLCYLYDQSLSSKKYLESFLKNHDMWWKKNYQSPAGFLNISFSSNYYRLNTLLYTLTEIDIYKDSPYSATSFKNTLKQGIEEEESLLELIKICSTYTSNTTDEKIKKHKKKIKKILILTSIGIIISNILFIFLFYFLIK